MANVTISGLTAKTTPVASDELEIQETGGGASKKSTISNLSKGFIAARGKCDAAGTLQAGSIGITSATLVATGMYDYTLSTAVSATATAQCFATPETVSYEVSASMISTTVCRVIVGWGGGLANVIHSVLIFDIA